MSDEVVDFERVAGTGRFNKTVKPRGKSKASAIKGSVASSDEPKQSEQDCSPVKSDPPVCLSKDEAKVVLQVISRSIKAGVFDGPDLAALNHVWGRLTSQLQ